MAGHFNARKAAQVVAFFAMKAATRQINILKVVKLVYLSDRESFATYGFPILDDLRVSMPQGPVNSETYRCVQGEVDNASSGWSDFLSDRANYQVGAKKSITLDDLDELSDADIECMEKVWKKFGRMDQWQLRDWTHERKNIPEWEDPHGSSNEIPTERILSFLGIENVDKQTSIIEDQKKLDKLFHSLRA